MAYSNAITLFVLVNVLLQTSVFCHKVPACPPSRVSWPSVSPPAAAKCPKDTLKFGVCGSWLGLVYEVVGSKPSKECCTLIQGIADLEAALCLCTAIKANVLGLVKLQVPVAVSLIVNACGKKVPDGFQCPN